MKEHTLNAPMGGTVRAINVKEHEHVHAGHALLGILDDKMLHMIVSEAEADVEHLRVSLGDKVVQGEPLVDLQEVDEQPEGNRLLDDAPDWELL